MTDKDIIKIFKNDKGCICSKKATKFWLNKHKGIKKYLKNRYKPFVSYNLVLKCIFKGYKELPKCLNCGKVLKNEDIRKKFCSAGCGARYPETNKKRMLTKLIKYNDPYYHNKEKCIKTYYKKTKKEKDDIKRKRKNTKISRYGDKNYNNRKKYEKTCILKYGFSQYFQTEDFKQKSKITKMKKYGNEKYTNKNKMHETKQRKYGDRNYTNREKARKTNLERYGNEVYSKTDNFKKKVKIKWENKTKNELKRIKEKRIQNNLKKYKEKWYHQTPEYHHKRIKKYLYNNNYFASIDELAFYIYHKNYKYKIIREPIKLKYRYKNTIHCYFPDFSVNGKLYEIKGQQFLNKTDGTWKNPYKNKKWTKRECEDNNNLYKAKYNCAIKNKVNIIYDCDKYKKYVINKYGKNFIKNCLVSS